MHHGASRDAQQPATGQACGLGSVTIAGGAFGIPPVEYHRRIRAISGARRMSRSQVVTGREEGGARNPRQSMSKWTLYLDRATV